MKIATTYKNGEIFERFSDAEQFKVYNTEGNKIISCDVVSTNGRKQDALLGFLNLLGVNLLICNGISDSAKKKLEGKGIEIQTGKCGNCDAVITAFLSEMQIN